jgi:hypothetical protein
MRKGSLFFLFLYLVLASGPLLADQSIRLRVSATIPPRPCEVPNTCDPVPANTQTKVVVENETVRYVGSPPEVTKKDGLMTVNF